MEDLFASDADGKRYRWDDATESWEPFFEGTKAEAFGIGLREGVAQSVEGLDWLDRHVNPTRMVSSRLLGENDPGTMALEPTTEAIRADPQRREEAIATYGQMEALGGATALAGDLLLPGPSELVGAGGRMAGRVGSRIGGMGRGIRAADEAAEVTADSLRRVDDILAPRRDLEYSGGSIADDSMGAARNPDTSGFSGTRRDKYGMLTPEEADAIGLPLTAGDRLALGAARGSDDVAKARQLRVSEELDRSAELGSIGNIRDATYRGVNRAREGQKEWFTKWLGATLGDPNVESLTRATRADLRAGTKAIFQKHIDNNPNPIGSQELAMDAHKIAEASTVDAKGQVEKWAKEITEAQEPGTGAIPGEKFSSLRKGIMDDMESAFGAGNYDLGKALSQLEELMDDALMKTLDPEDIAELKEARKQWRYHKALQYRSATDRGGELNPVSFMNAYDAVTPGFKRASRAPTPEESLIETMAYLQAKVQPDSGTVQRLLNAVRNTGLGPQGAVGAGLLGGGGAAAHFLGGS